MKIIGTLTLALVVGVAGCATTHELTDTPVTLQPHQGIAAVVLNAPNRITQITFTAKDPGGSDFEVPDTQGGPSLYLVPVVAGRYCLKHFRYWRAVFNSVQDLGCFTVIAAHITYTGDLVPSQELSGAILDQQYNPDGFLTMLHQQYPVIAKLYPIAAAPAPPASVNATSAIYPISTWVTDLAGRNAQAIFVQNNTSWSQKIVSFRLFRCVNVKQVCGTRQMDVVVGPFARKELTVIEPAGEGAYQYQYDYQYQTVD